MWNFWNRLWNTAMIAPRLAWTAINTASDTVNTFVALPKDALDVIQSTTNDIKNVFIDSWTKWKWYQRVGNVILSPVIATWTAIEWAVRTAVTPVVNWVVNGRNTVKNTVKNAWRSSFGRVFSKKPISDFSYDQLKTANVINKNKNRFSKLQFWKKKNLERNTNKDKEKTTATIAGATAAATTTTATNSIWEKEISNLKNQMKDLNDKISNIQDQLKSALESKKKEEKINKDSIEKKSTESKEDNNTNAWEKTTIKKEKDEKWNDNKAEKKSEEKVDKNENKEKNKKEKIDKEDWKNNEDVSKENDNKDEKKENKEKDDVKESWKKEENTNEWKKNDKNEEWKESLDKDAKRKWIDDAKKLLEDSTCWQKILDWLCKDKNFWIVFDESTSDWRIDSKQNIIKIGTLMPKDGSNGLAPWNWKEKDPEYQKRHVLLHELAHCAVNSNKEKIPEIQKWLNIIKKYINKEKDNDGKTLSAISHNNKEYKTIDAKATEDFVEILALCMNWNWKACKKYMELLSSDDDNDKKLRGKYGLAKITKDDAQTLENACKAVVKFYE